MRNFFKSEPRSILAIDISSSSVKILELSHSDNILCVEGYGCNSLPLDAIDGNTIKDIDAVAQCIKTIYERAHLSCKKVALAVPDSAVISRVMQINAGLKDDEIEELVLLEADKHIPHPIDEINLDFELLGPSSQNSTMLDVLIVASRTENINARVEAVTRAGLEAFLVDVESYAVARAAVQQIKELDLDGKDKVVAIIDIGTRFSNVLVMHGTELIFSKVLASFQEPLLVEIKRTLQFFYSINHHGFVDHILLAGRLPEHPSISQLIEEQLGIPTSIANPLSQLTFSENINLELINNDAPLLLIACGLALRNVE